MRSPQGGQSAGKGRLTLVMCPRRGSDPTSGTSWGAKVAVGDGSPTAGMGCPLGRTWPTARAVAVFCVDPTPSSEMGTVWGCVGTTYQGKGKGCREVRVGQTGRGRALGAERLMGSAAYGGKGLNERTTASGERPIDAASFRRQSIQASNPPPPSPYMGATPSGFMSDV